MGKSLVTNRDRQVTHPVTGHRRRASRSCNYLQLTDEGADVEGRQWVRISSCWRALRTRLCPALSPRTHFLPQLGRVGPWDRNLQTGQGQVRVRQRGRRAGGGMAAAAGPGKALEETGGKAQQRTGSLCWSQWLPARPTALGAEGGPQGLSGANG